MSDHDTACLYCGEHCDGRHYATLDPTLRGQILAALEESDQARMIDLQAQVRAGLNNSTTPAAPWGSSSERTAASSSAVPEIVWRSEPEEVVLLHGGAHARLTAEASDSRDGRETGGWLLLDTLGHDDTEFHAATGPGERAQFEPNRVGLDLGHRIAIEERAQRLDSKLVIAGDFHTHQGREPRPSEGDRTAWARSFEFLENDLGPRAAWTGIVLTSKYDDDWRYPELHGYVLRRDPITRRLTCENAIVKEVD